MIDTFIFNVYVCSPTYFRPSVKERHSMISKPPTLRLKIQSMSYGGRGVARQDGKVYFVPRGLPGQTVDATVITDKAMFAECRLESVVESSLYHDAPCRYFDECGGCQWQQADSQTQVSWKKEFIRDAFSRIAKIPLQDHQLDMIGAENSFHYRNRIQLRGRILESGLVQVGFFASKSRQLVAISECLIADKHLKSIVKYLSQAKVSSGCKQSFRVELQVFEDLQLLGGFGVSALFHGVSGVQKGLKELISQVADLDGVVWCSPEGQKPKYPMVLEKVMNIRHFSHPGQFSQVNREMNKKMIEQVLSWAERMKAPLGRLKVVDLFCGSGNISLHLLAQNYLVDGVEIGRHSVQLAKHASLENGFSERSHFYAEPVDRYLARIGSGLSDYELAVVDPPRKGMADCVADFVEHGPKHLIYISCDPVSLARDVKALSEKYRILEVVGFDFFPQTYHVETALLLARI